MVTRYRLQGGTMKRPWSGVLVGLGIGATLAWAAGPTSLAVKFKLPPSVNSVKPVALVDGDGNLLFNSTTPGKVQVVNPTSSGLGAIAASDVVTMQSSSACPSGPGEIFDQVVKPDGSFTTFSIPAGKVFVITALSVAGGTGSPQAIPGNPVQVQLHINGSFYSATDQNVDLGPSKSLSLHQTFPTGIVVGSGSPICVVGVDLVTATSVGVSGTINGYMATDS
jgi:hypothetical protein